MDITRAPPSHFVRLMRPVLAAGLPRPLSPSNLLLLPLFCCRRLIFEENVHSAGPVQRLESEKKQLLRWTGDRPPFGVAVDVWTGIDRLMERHVFGLSLAFVASCQPISRRPHLNEPAVVRSMNENVPFSPWILLSVTEAMRDAARDKHFLPLRCCRSATNWKI